MLFFAACKATYGVNDEVAAAFVAQIRIEHLYGVTTQLQTVSQSGVRFDCDREFLYGSVSKAEKEIWLIDDDRQRQSKAFTNARLAVEHAKLVVFLGYGFDEINDENLGIARLKKEIEVHNNEIENILTRAPRIVRIPGGEEIDMRGVPKSRYFPRFTATTLGMYEREVNSARSRMSLSAGDKPGQVSTLSKNCYEALREWGTFDLLR